jgi:hypothetical protein
LRQYKAEAAIYLFGAAFGNIGGGGEAFPSGMLSGRKQCELPDVMILALPIDNSH